jgi:N utilization substance protein A
MADGLVEIANVAREPGYRSKIAVVSYADGVDPVGACVGPRGSRVRMVVSELRGEKIDIIPYNEEPARFVAKALSPARVREVVVDDEARQATVIVPDDQLALAIGREGQNARLAARLTGWRIDIRSESEFATEAPDGSISADEEVGGRCVAVLTNGRRCPNAALPGTSSCGLPAHIALGRFSGNSVALVAELSDEEIERFADPEVAAAELTERVTAIEAVVEKAQAEAAAVAAAQAEADALAAAQAEADAAQAEAAEGAEQAEAEDQDAEAEVEATEADDAEADEAAVEETEVAETEEAEAEPEADAESAAPEETT